MAERPPGAPDPGAPLRVQILATEHWALLAARTTTQNELLVRIGLLLTVVSAGLVTVGLLAPALGFDQDLAVAAFGIDAFVWLLAVLTLLRVLNASAEDAVLVLAMNRLRGAYVDLDAGVEPYLVQSPHDDDAGLGRTYFPLPRSTAVQTLASSGVFLLLICTVLTGVLVATGLLALGAAIAVAVVTGAVVALLFAVAVAALEGRRIGRLLGRWTPLKPTRDAEHPEAAGD